MLDKIKQLFEFSARNGMFLPMAFDGANERPSATLFFTYFTYLLTVASIIYTFFDNNAFTPVVSSIILFVICLTIYRIRRLDSVELDLDDRSIKIKGNDAKESETK